MNQLIFNYLIVTIFLIEIAYQEGDGHQSGDQNLNSNYDFDGDFVPVINVSQKFNVHKESFFFLQKPIYLIIRVILPSKK